MVWLYLLLLFPGSLHGLRLPNGPPRTDANTLEEDTASISCECVPWYLCGNNGIITYGAGLLDLRTIPVKNVKKCQNIMHTCCPIPLDVDEEVSHENKDKTELPPNTPCECMSYMECPEHLIVNDGKGKTCLTVGKSSSSHSKCPRATDVCCASATEVDLPVGLDLNLAMNEASKMNNCECVEPFMCDNQGYIERNYEDSLNEVEINQRGKITLMSVKECSNSGKVCCRHRVECECVNQDNCDEEGFIITDGSSLIDVGMFGSQSLGICNDPCQVCCKHHKEEPTNVTITSTTTIPTEECFCVETSQCYSHSDNNFGLGMLDENIHKCQNPEHICCETPPAPSTTTTNITASTKSHIPECSQRNRKGTLKTDGNWTTCREVAGPSEPSNPSDSVLCKDPPGKPGKPNSTDSGANFVHLEWDADIEKYVIEKKELPDGNWTKCGEVAGTENRINITDVEEGEEYEFRVIAVNKAGPSEPSNPSESVICKEPPGKPGKPNPTDSGADFVDLEWNEPDDADHADIEKYVIEKKKLPDGNWTKCGEVAGTDNSTKITNIQEDEKYEFRIIAVNKAGPSEPSNPSYSVICKDPPGKPGKLNPTVFGKNFVDLEWAVPEDADDTDIEKYIIEKKEMPYGDWITCGEVAGTEHNAKITNIEEGEEYEFRVIAVNAAGPSEPSTPSMPACTKPGSNCGTDSTCRQTCLSTENVSGSCGGSSCKCCKRKACYSPGSSCGTDSTCRPSCMRTEDVSGNCGGTSCKCCKRKACYSPGSSCGTDSTCRPSCLSTEEVSGNCGGTSCKCCKRKTCYSPGSSCGSNSICRPVCLSTEDAYGNCGGTSCKCCKRKACYTPGSSCGTDSTCRSSCLSTENVSGSCGCTIFKCCKRKDTSLNWLEVGSDRFVRFEWMTWDLARLHCQSNGLDLFVPNNAIDVAKYLINIYGDIYWLGARGNGTHQVWKPTGEAVKKNYWYRDSYNKVDTGKCVGLLAHSHYPFLETVLYTLSCTTQQAFLCG